MRSPILEIDGVFCFELSNFCFDFPDEFVVWTGPIVQKNQSFLSKLYGFWSVEFASDWLVKGFLDEMSWILNGGSVGEWVSGDGSRLDLDGGGSGV